MSLAGLVNHGVQTAHLDDPTSPTLVDVGLRPSSIAWQGTVLRDIQVDEAVRYIADRLIERGVSNSSTVLMESDDSGRSVVTLLALAHLSSSVLLIDDVDRLSVISPTGFNYRAITHKLVFRDLPPTQARDTTDMRPAFSVLEKGVSPESVHDRMDLRQWFARDRALGLFSSGTRTGQPSLIWKSGAELLENAQATALALSYTSNDVMLPLLPMHGQYGVSVILVAVASGAGIACCHRTRMGEVLRTISRHGVTTVDATPTVYKHLLDEIQRKSGALQRLALVRVFGVGGEPLVKTLSDNFYRITNQRLIDGYGLTQLGNVAFSTFTEQFGLYPLDTYRVRIASEDDSELEPGQIGRILVARVDGQPLNAPEESVWFDTGDLGQSNGRAFRVVGREGMINRNGDLIPITYIEDQLSNHGIEAYAVSVPFAVSHRLWLLIHDPLHRPTEYWKERVNQTLDRRFRPDVIQVIGYLPLEKSGKVSRFRLQGLAAGLQSSRALGRTDSRTPLGQLRAKLLEHRHEIMELVSTMADQQTAQHDFRAMMNVLDHAEGELNLYGTPPKLPVDVFMPRNALLESFAIYCLVPSLWARRVRLRPALGTEAVVSRLIEICRQVSSVPLEYDVSDQQQFVASVSQEPSIVLFTGLRTNAESILTRLSNRHLFLYFGKGVNPVLIFPGADLDRTSQEIVYSRLYNGGQDCLSPDLILVHKSLEASLLSHLAHYSTEYVQTNGGFLAPLLKDETIFTALHYLMKHSSGIVCGGEMNYGARTFSPAIVRVSGSEVEKPHEHFAPIFSVATFSEDYEVEQLLRSEYYLENGFGAALYGDSEELAHTLTNHYLISQDQSLAQAIPSFEPFGGHGVESGYVMHRGIRRLGPINITQVAVQFGNSVQGQS